MNVKYILAVFFISSLSSHVWAAPCNSHPVELKHNEWTQISLPCDPRSNDTVAKIFGDGIETALGRAGILGEDWVVWKYDNGYTQLESGSEMVQGAGYWIIQATGQDLEFDMPEGSTSTKFAGGPPESSFSGIELNTNVGNHSWNMVGNPFAVAVTNVYVSYEGLSTKDCPNINPGCELADAETAGIVHKKLYRYDGENRKYDLFDGRAAGLNPWDGFWVATLNKADGEFPELIITRVSPAN